MIVKNIQQMYWKFCYKSNQSLDNLIPLHTLRNTGKVTMYVMIDRQINVLSYPVFSFIFQS